MNIKEALLQDEVHLKKQAVGIASYACESAVNFKELMQCFLANDYRLAQRAAWSVSWAVRKKPELIQPYVKDLVAQLQRKDVHKAVIRNSVRILEMIDVAEPFHGEIMNACFSFIETPATPVAIKAFALSMLFKLSENYPDIRHELKLIIEERMRTETAAFKSRGRKILEQLSSGE